MEISPAPGFLHLKYFSTGSDAEMILKTLLLVPVCGLYITKRANSPDLQAFLPLLEDQEVQADPDSRKEHVRKLHI